MGFYYVLDQQRVHIGESNKAVHTVTFCFHKFFRFPVITESLKIDETRYLGQQKHRIKDFTPMETSAWNRQVGRGYQKLTTRSFLWCCFHDQDKNLDKEVKEQIGLFLF